MTCVNSNGGVLLFTPCTVTRYAMHRIYAKRINSRCMSRVFCDLCSQKTPRGILSVNSNGGVIFVINRRKIDCKYTRLDDIFDT